jgi:hypothetical protein
MNFLQHWAIPGLISAVFVAACALAPRPLLAYLDRLTEDDVDQAYILGNRHDQDLVKFLRDYETTFGIRTPGLHVSRIAVRTPYCFVVVHSFEKGSTYPMVKAREEFAGQAVPFGVVVSVTGSYQNTYNADDLADPKGNFWKQFAVELSQERTIAARAMRAAPVYGTSGSNTFITGAELYLDYDVRDVASTLARIRVTGPGTQSVTAEFDLDKLR